MRYVLVDRVTAMRRGESLEAQKVFPMTDEAIPLGLEFRPAVPACLLIECMAQAGGLLLSSERAGDAAGVVFAKIEQTTFLDDALPGDPLVVRCLVLERGEEATRLTGQVDGPRGRVAEMTYWLVTRPPAEGVQADVDQEAFVRSHVERVAVLGIRDLLGGDR